MHRLTLLGLNHQTASLAVRERVAFNRQQQRSALQLLMARYPGAEFVLVSTCNRVELYAAGEGAPDAAMLCRFLEESHDLSAGTLAGHVYSHAGPQAVGHLFRVTASLDSMVLGETQILGQVRHAYELARDEQAAGGLMHPLFQKALAVAKKVMTQTGLAEGRMSVASVAVDYAQQIFDRLSDKAVLCVGAGEMAQLVLASFQSAGWRKLTVCNRDALRGKALAEQFAGEARPWETLPDELATADVVVTSTASSKAVILAEGFGQVMKRRRYRPLFLIDIAVPRDVEPEVGRYENVYLYNLDDLQQVVSQTLASRTEQLAAATALVEDETARYTAWHRQRAMGPTIDQLYRRCYDIAQSEVARTANRLPDMTDLERRQLDELARRIVNKVLHGPVKAMRDGEPHTRQPYQHAVEKLFGLGDALDSLDAEDDAVGVARRAEAENDTPAEHRA
ncbi:MAG: glutamyl-tRNA reductase [Phycisphaerae bacterium]